MQSVQGSTTAGRQIGGKTTLPHKPGVGRVVRQPDHRGTTTIITVASAGAAEQAGLVVSSRTEKDHGGGDPT
jgi:hypothetical protein